jgi:hypothetical protein
MGKIGYVAMAKFKKVREMLLCYKFGKDKALLPWLNIEKDKATLLPCKRLK